MKKYWKIIKILITLGVVIFFFVYFFNHKEDFNAVLSIPISSFIILLALSGLHFFLNGLFILVILRSFGTVISGLKSFYISIISSLGNYFLPMQGGAVIRSVYLKKNYNFSYSHFLSTLYGNYIVIFGVNAFVATFSLILIHIRNGFFSIPLYIFFGFLLMGMIFLGTLRFRIDRVKERKSAIINRILEVLKNVMSGWNTIISHKHLLLQLLLITTINFILMVVIYWVEFSVLGITKEIINIVLYNCLSGVTLLVSITPGSLGLREAIFILTSEILGITNDQVMQLALLDRGLMVITLILSFILLSFSNHLFSEKKFDD